MVAAVTRRPPALQAASAAARSTRPGRGTLVAQAASAVRGRLEQAFTSAAWYGTGGSEQSSDGAAIGLGAPVASCAVGAAPARRMMSRSGPQTTVAALRWGAIRPTRLHTTDRRVDRRGGISRRLRTRECRRRHGLRGCQRRRGVTRSAFIPRSGRTRLGSAAGTGGVLPVGIRTFLHDCRCFYPTNPDLGAVADREQSLYGGESTELRGMRGRGRHDPVPGGRFQSGGRLHQATSRPLAGGATA